MPLQRASHFAQCPQYVFREVPRICQDGVERRAAVSFREEDPVAPWPGRPLWVVPEFLIIEDEEYLDKRQTASRMARTGQGQHLEYVLAYLYRLLLQFRH